MITSIQGTIWNQKWKYLKSWSFCFYLHKVTIDASRLERKTEKMSWWQQLSPNPSTKLKQDWKAFYLAPFSQIVDYFATYVFTLSVYNLLIMSVHKYIPIQKFEMKHSVLLKKFKMG